jgi:Mlc titration factor MtfA (ptsG expression regulator)
MSVLDGERMDDVSEVNDEGGIDPVAEVDDVLVAANQQRVGAVGVDLLVGRPDVGVGNDDEAEPWLGGVGAHRLLVESVSPHTLHNLESVAPRIGIMRIETPRQRRRHKAIEAPFPDEWRTLLSTNMVHWRMLDDAERSRLEDLVKGFLFDKRFEWVDGLEESEDIKVLVAASACLLILGLENSYYRDVTSIIMYPSNTAQRGHRAAPEAAGLATDAIVPILGEAMLHGPVIIAWDSAKRSAAHPATGHNVIYHEFAHKIDMADGAADGLPPMAREQRERWEEVCRREYEALRDGTNEDPFLDVYGAVNRAEFFAVATELFFDRPVDMQRHEPDLYDVLREFYRQDPAARQRRHP